MAHRIALPLDTDLDHLASIRQLAINLMREHGLHGWSLQWSGAKREAGSCDCGKRTISLSARIMATWPVAECRDTILHEIAHALAGHAAGHGPAWKATAARIGANPERCYDAGINYVPRKYTGTCRNGHTVYRDRLTDRALEMSCGKCADYFDPEYKFTWKEN